MMTTSSNTVSTDGKYIIQKVVGDLTTDLALQFNIETHSLGRELGINNYLVDLTEARNVDTPLGNYNFAYHDMKLNPGIDRSACVALLVEDFDTSHDFVEVVAKNAGLDITIFQDRDAAIRHLTKPLLR